MIDGSEDADPTIAASEQKESTQEEAKLSDSKRSESKQEDSKRDELKTASGEELKTASGEELKTASGEELKRTSGEELKTASGEELKTASHQEWSVPLFRPRRDLEFLKVTVQLLQASGKCWSACEKRAEIGHEDTGALPAARERFLKNALHAVSGSFSGGSIVALMGGSGAGKTTLLTVISNRLRPTSVWRRRYVAPWCGGPIVVQKGGVFVNGCRASASYFSQKSAFVPQDSILLPAFTVREHIAFACDMRLPWLSASARRQKTDRVMADMQLTDCADTRVGDELMRGLSGGQARRLSIAIEIVHDPEVIFLDEPTTGLDSQTAAAVMKVVCKLSLPPRNALVICSIHQPSADIFRMFTHLVLLFKGQVVYSGPAPSAAASIAHELSIPGLHHRENPADFCVSASQSQGESWILQRKALRKAGKKAERKARRRAENLRRRQGLGDSKRGGQEEEQEDDGTASVSSVLSASLSSEDDNSSRSTDAEKKPDVSSAGNRVKTGVTKPGFFFELGKLTARAWSTFLRTPMQIEAKLVQVVALILLIGGAFYQIGNEQRSVQDRFGVIYFILICQMFANSMHVVLSFADERAVFLREQANELYSVFSYFLGKTIVSLPTIFVFTVPYAVAIYALVGFVWDVAKIVHFVLVLLLVSYVGEGVGLLIGAICATRMMAVIVAPMAIAPTILFSRYALPLESIPRYFIWLQWLSPFWWSFDALAATEFQDLELHCAPGQEYKLPSLLPSETFTQSICRWTSGNAVLDYYHISPGEIGADLWALAGLALFYRTVAFFCLRHFSSHVRPSSNQ